MNKKVKNVIRYLILILMMFIEAINYNLFFNPHQIIAGGSDGLSIVVEKVFGINPAIFILIFCVVILIFSFIILGVELTTSSIVAVLVYPIFIYITSGISSISYFETTDTLLVAIYSGIIFGIVLGVICRIGFSSGGVIQISQILNKIFKIPISVINFTLNFIILLCGSFVFGFDVFLVSVVAIFITNLVMNKIILGTSSNKSFLIMTKKDKEIVKYINSLGHKVTHLGIDENSKRETLMIVIPTREYYRFTSDLKKIDKDIFYVVTDSYQLEGGK